MSPLLKGVLVAGFQLALLGVVGGKLLYDRSTMPRAWMETAGVDPDLPIRGRYVALDLVLPLAPGSPALEGDIACGHIELIDGKPVAVPETPAGEAGRPFPAGQICFHRRDVSGELWTLREPVAYFLSEHAQDPTLHAGPGELWAEVTLPPRGAPRPIRLGLKRDGRIEPLD